MLLRFSIRVVLRGVGRKGVRLGVVLVRGVGVVYGGYGGGLRVVRFLVLLDVVEVVILLLLLVGQQVVVRGQH